MKKIILLFLATMLGLANKGQAESMMAKAIVFFAKAFSLKAEALYQPDPGKGFEEDPSQSDVGTNCSLQ